jgi:hypothetical protein
MVYNSLFYDASPSEWDIRLLRALASLCVRPYWEVSYSVLFGYFNANQLRWISDCGLSKKFCWLQISSFSVGHTCSTRPI